MGLVWAFDAVLPVLPTGREQRRDLVNAGAAGTPKRTGRVADGLADLEPVIAHTILLLHPIVLRRRDFGPTAQDFSTQHRSLQLLRLSELTGRYRKPAEQFMRSAPERLDLSAKRYLGCKDRRGLASILLRNVIENRFVASRNLHDLPGIPLDQYARIIRRFLDPRGSGGSDTAPTLTVASENS
jgi:hypothetical protein